MSDITKTVDEQYTLSSKKGGGVLRREVWTHNKSGKVVAYNLTYINHAIYQGDNGRVLGYDNSHDYHHRHFCGEVTAVSFTSFEDTAEKFEAEWLDIRNGMRGK